ncbi:MAG TPA: hypothetical protein DD670_03010, partial [Planctomycetaceae bacterium]|nr:hypothetical protein [Planctomycetaceae bacterium]
GPRQTPRPDAPTRPDAAARGQAADGQRWTRPVAAVPPPLPKGARATGGEAQDPTSASGRFDALSPTERVWQKGLLWIGLALAAVLLVGLVLLIVFSKGSTTGQNAEQPADPTADQPADPSADPATKPDADNLAAAVPTAGELNVAWIADDARMVVSLTPSRLADRSGMDRMVEAAGPAWEPVIEKILAGFSLGPHELRRVTWSASDLTDLARGSLVAIELEPTVDASRLATAGAAAGLRFRGRDCRRLTEGEWTEPFALLGEHTIVTGRPEMLRALAARTEPRLTSRALAKMFEVLGDQAELSLLLDLAAAREAGWRLPDGTLNVWPEGADSWNTLWRVPEGLGIDLRIDGRTMHSKIDLVCADIPTSETVLAAVERLVPGGKDLLDQREKALGEPADEKIDDEKVPAVRIEGYRLLLREVVAALGATRWEQFETTVRVRTDWSRDFLGVGLLALDAMAEVRGDWLSALGRVLETRQSRLLEGIEDYRRANGYYPAAAVGGGLLPPETRLSWMATLLPYYGHGDWHDRLQFGLSWNAGENAPVTKQPLSEAVNPAFGPSATPEGYPVTHYVGSAGLGDGAGKLSADDPRAGMFGFGRQTRPSQIKDGASNTIAILGVSRDPGPWASGGRATVRALTQSPYVDGPDGFGTGQPDGMYVGMADGSVRFLSKDIDPQVMERLVTINDGGPPVALPGAAEGPAADTPPKTASSEPKPDGEAEPTPEQDPAADKGAEAEPPAIEIPAEIAAKLDRPIGHIALENVKLGGLVHTVRQITELEISFDQAALEKAAVTLDTLVSVDLKDTTVGQVLSEALAQCFLIYTVRDGRLLVTSPEPLKTK